MQVPIGTGPGIRRSQCPLLASRTRCNVLWKQGQGQGTYTLNSMIGLLLLTPGTWSHIWFAGVRECPPWCSIVGASDSAPVLLYFTLLSSWILIKFHVMVVHDPRLCDDLSLNCMYFILQGIYQNNDTIGLKKTPLSAYINSSPVNINKRCVLSRNDYI